MLGLRSPSPLLCFATFLTIALAVNCIATYIYGIVANSGILHDLLFQPETFVETYEDGFEYNGRWIATPDQKGRDASFGGSSFEFSVFNTTYVTLVLANAAVKHHGVDIEDSDQSSLVLNLAKTLSGTEGPVDFIHTVNGSSNATYHRNVCYFRALSRQLNPNAVHTFRVTLPYSENPRVFQFRGLWLTKGGQLVSNVVKDTQHPTKGEQDKSKNTDVLREEDGINQRTLIEIMAPTNLLGHTCSSSNLTDKTTMWTVNWPSLLQDNFLDSTFSTVPISSKSYITSNEKTTLPQITFLRSGPPNSTLYPHPWSFTSKTSNPGALILTLGLSDVESFLSASTHGKHDVTAFIDSLSSKQSDFIQMLRRTVYSPSALAGSHNGNIPQRKNGYIDESHLYNSAPSTLPIFIVLPPIPSSLLVEDSHQLKSVLHHAATKTLNDLKWQIGDQKTIIVDTAGWLDDADFISCRTKSDIVTSFASDFTLTQAGHIKFAHHLSLHLCPYIAGGKEKCPFEKHGEYVGNLAVPETDAVGKLLEQKRVGRIKGMFGVN